MTNKKIIKQMMAIGVQRNDAAAFAKTYRKIMDAGLEDLFPEIIKPVMPVRYRVENYNLTTLRAQCTVPDIQMELLADSQGDLYRRVTGKLATLLADELVNSGAMKISAEKVRFGVQFTGDVKVVFPFSETRREFREFSQHTWRRADHG